MRYLIFVTLLWAFSFNLIGVYRRPWTAISPC